MAKKTLAACPLCQRAYITALSAHSDLRRRLTELGFIPGNPVTPLFRSPLGDPTAYAIMDGIIALRKKDAEDIFISSVPEVEL